MFTIEAMDPASPRIAALGPSWICIGDVTADTSDHKVAAEPGTVITAEGGCTVQWTAGETRQMRRQWTLRVTGDVKRDAVTLAVVSPLGSGIFTGSVSVCGVVLDSDSGEAVL